VVSASGHRRISAGASRVRVLGRADLDDALALLRRDPVVNVFAHYRTVVTQLEPRWLGGEMWGWYVDGRLDAMCHVAANVVPVNADDVACSAFAARLRKERPDFVTIVGPRTQVEGLWNGLEGHVPGPRELRWDQPHMVIDHDPAVEPDPLVTCTSEDRFEALYPACVAMYTEEVGVSPESHGGRSLYQARVRQLLGRGWSFSRIEDGEVVFKAEVACVTEYAAQVQGVYVAPHRRGEGLGTRGMAAVAAHVRRNIAPAVSLYVNGHNAPARAAYIAAGFRQTETFSTLMF
jgi:predicted GNAT family acetyltransferase